MIAAGDRPHQLPGGLAMKGLHLVAGCTKASDQPGFARGGTAAVVGGLPALPALVELQRVALYPIDTVREVGDQA